MTRREEEILREELVGRGLDGEELEREFADAAAEVDAGRPLAYVIGKWWFCAETYRVTDGVLIPQPDTEILVETAAALLPRDAVIADAGCGSGCIGISLANMRRDVRCFSFDISEKAMETAACNAEECGCADRVKVCRGDILRGELIPPCGGEFFGYDAILSNPPYIRSGVIPTLDIQVQNEPRLALDGGEDGLDFYRALIKHAPALLKNGGGLLILEIGYDQGGDIAALAAAAGYDCSVKKDYGGNDRVAVINVSRE